MLAILDAGIAGLRTARAIMERLPDCDIVYFGDAARAPYGDKSPEVVRRYALQSAEILLSEGAKALVIVSHTIACAAGREMRKAFDVPVLDTVDPVVGRALAASEKLRFGVIGSRAVVGSDRYAEAIRSINPDARVYSAACPLMAALVSENWLKKPETVRIVKKHLHPLKARQIDTLILGGSHYTFLRKIIQVKIGKRVELVDAGDILPAAAVRFVQAERWAGRGVNRGGTRRFLVTDLSEHLARSAKRFFNGNISLTLLKPDGGR